MRSDCGCHTQQHASGIKFITVCRIHQLIDKIRHWEMKKTKKGNRYARHYRWILRREEG
jgi:hypothetical protein